MSDAKVSLRENGPILVEGPVTLCDHHGNTIDTGGKDKFFLCRCGQTANGPFCDGSHKAADFKADDSPKS